MVKVEVVTRQDKSSDDRGLARCLHEELPKIIAEALAKSESDLRLREKDVCLKFVRPEGYDIIHHGVEITIWWHPHPSIENIENRTGWIWKKVKPLLPQNTTLSIDLFAADGAFTHHENLN